MKILKALNKGQQRKQLKLIKAHQNNIIISTMNLKDKYTHFEDSQLNKSKTLLYEISRNNRKYKQYGRGKIVRVKFGVNVGSEFSGDHFAIVVSKQDTMMSSTLHVVPITSKKHLKNINIGNILYCQKEIDNLNKIFNYTIDNKEKRKIKSCIKFYEKRKNTISYACYDHMKTISKLSIANDINEFDYISKLKCPPNIMKKIDECIIKEYTI